MNCLLNVTVCILPSDQCVLVSQILGTHPNMPRRNPLPLFTWVLHKTRSSPFLNSRCWCKMICQGFFSCPVSRKASAGKQLVGLPPARVFAAGRSPCFATIFLLPMTSPPPPPTPISLELHFLCKIYFKKNLRTSGPYGSRNIKAEGEVLYLPDK